MTLCYSLDVFFVCSCCSLINLNIFLHLLIKLVFLSHYYFQISEAFTKIFISLCLPFKSLSFLGYIQVFFIDCWYFSLIICNVSRKNLRHGDNNLVALHTICIKLYISECRRPGGFIPCIQIPMLNVFFSCEYLTVIDHWSLI